MRASAPFNSHARALRLACAFCSAGAEDHGQLYVRLPWLLRRWLLPDTHERAGERGTTALSIACAPWPPSPSLRRLSTY
eukprot:6197973-Pleurochrysis_carterae.AAC.6